MHNSPFYLQFVLVLHSILIALFSIYRLLLLLLAQFSFLSEVYTLSSFNTYSSILNLSFTLASSCTILLFICSLYSFFILFLKIFSQYVVYFRFFFLSAVCAHSSFFTYIFFSQSVVCPCFFFLSAVCIPSLIHTYYIVSFVILPHYKFLISNRDVAAQICFLRYHRLTSCFNWDNKKFFWRT